MRERRAMDESIARCWRELSGENYWADLLQKKSLDSDFRRYIIHYCQMAGAIGDLFEGGAGSKEDFFSRAGLVEGNPFKYDVTRFLYTGSNLVESKWFGYVAVATDEGKRALGRRDILVAWRGTKGKFKEWFFHNAKFLKRSVTSLFPTAKVQGAAVHRGFYSLYTTKGSRSCGKTSARQQVLKAVRELVNKYEEEEISITVTGFSLGGALATLTAMDIVVNEYNKPTTGNSDTPCMVTAFTYGSPPIGNAEFKTLFDTFGKELPLLRIVNEKDPVPKITSKKKILGWKIPYVNFGEKLTVDTTVSSYLKCRKRNGVGSKRKRISGAVVPVKDDEDGDEPKPKRKHSISASDEDEPKPKRKRLDGNEDEYEPKSKSKRKRLDGDEDEDKPKSKSKRKRNADPSNEDEPITECRRSGTGPSDESKEENVCKETPWDSHNLDVYAHGVAIKGIEKNTPVIELAHDIALVNKHSDRVKQEYRIPGNWWASENRKKMVQDFGTGRWEVVRRGKLPVTNQAQ